jgi:diaminohydroxyphosphoribosylaminopyrimidine deaminase/5-amino-6-(5-phosphoribosylamino)uracil reductase
MDEVPAAASPGPMDRALQLAALGLYTTDPNPRVGCVIEQGGHRVGEGWHVRAGEPHAEVLALREAGSKARGATVHVTLEPCSHTGRTPPCADALIAARVARVVCSTVDPNPRVAGAGIERLRAAGIAVEVGSCADEARELNPGFFSRFERGRPFVRLKLAMSLDARTAPALGGKTWITGEASRADVQTLRARSSAVLTGAGTVRIDDPRLDVRLAYGPWIRQPLRVLLDTELSTAPGARIFGGSSAGNGDATSTGTGTGIGGGVLVFAAADAKTAVPDRATASCAAIERVARADSGLDLGAVLERLAAREVNELMVECGPSLAGSFLRGGWVDELILYVAPRFLGADAPPLAALYGIAAPGGPAGFDFHDVRRFGADLRLILRPGRA